MYTSKNQYIIFKIIFIVFNGLIFLLSLVKLYLSLYEKINSTTSFKRSKNVKT